MHTFLRPTFQLSITLLQHVSLSFLSSTSSHDICWSSRLLGFSQEPLGYAVS